MSKFAGPLWVHCVPVHLAHIYTRSRNIITLKSEHLGWLERLCSQIKIILCSVYRSVWYVQMVLWCWCSHRLARSLRPAVQVTYIRSVDNSTTCSSMLVSMETTMRRCCTLNVCVQEYSGIFHCLPIDEGEYCDCHTYTTGVIER